MKKAYRIIILLFILSGCLDEITLKDQRFEAVSAVIQGRLVKGTPSTAEVSVRRLGDFGNEVETHISGAKVVLLTTNGATIELQEDRFNKIYRTTIPASHPSFSVQSGQFYRLQVQLPNGRKYESDAESLFPIPKMENIRFQSFQRAPTQANSVRADLPYLRFQVNTPLTIAGIPGKTRLRWSFSSVYRLTDNSTRTCYYSEKISPQKVIICDGDLFDATRLDTFTLAETQLDHRLAEGFYLTAIQESLSPGAFAYWDQVRQLSERSGNMFDPPAGKIITNIRALDNGSAQPYGYFYATEQDTLRMLIRPGQVGNPKKFCPLSYIPPGPTICDNCLLQGGTLIKPGYWIE